MSSLLSNIEAEAKIILHDAGALLAGIESNVATLYKAISNQVAQASPTLGLSASQFGAIASEVLAYANTQFKKYATAKEVSDVVLPEISRVLLLVAPLIPNPTILGVLQSMILGMVTTAISAEFTTAAPVVSPSTQK